MSTVTITGVNDLARRFRIAPKVMRELCSTVAEDAARSIARRAKAEVPVATGALRRAIAVEGAGLAWIVGVRPGGEPDPSIYARFVEYGTSRMAARPFMRPAAELEQSAMQGRLDREVARVLAGRLRAA